MKMILVQRVGGFIRGTARETLIPSSASFRGLDASTMRSLLRVDDSKLDSHPNMYDLSNLAHICHGIVS